MWCRVVVWLSASVGNRLLVGTSRMLGEFKVKFEVGAHESGGILDMAAARDCIMPLAVAQQGCVMFVQPSGVFSPVEQSATPILVMSVKVLMTGNDAHTN